MNRHKIVAIATSLAAFVAVFVVAASVNPAAATIRPTTATTIVPRKPWPASTASPAPSPSLATAPALLMSIGDSITYGADGGDYASYRQEMTRLLNLAKIPHYWNVQAIGGTKCSYWAAQIATLLDTYNPALVLLDCGTNDTPTDDTRADYAAILAAATSRGIPIVASYIGVPDMQTDVNRARPYIIDWMHATNVSIKDAIAAYPGVPVADFQRIPHNFEWSTDGIHPNARGEAAMAQIFYQAAQPTRPGWPTFQQLGIREMCGLNGSYPGDPEPIPYEQYHVCGRE